jgi:nicotinamidase-related amidase
MRYRLAPLGILALLAASACGATPSSAPATGAPKESAPAAGAGGGGVPAIPAIPAPVAVTVDPRTTAYLVLDLTTVICSPQPHCVATLPAAAALLKKARAAHALVVYSQTPTPGTQVRPEVAPLPGDPQVKGHADKFFGTDLEQVLKSHGIKTVVVVGSASNGAVLYTTFGANLRGYTAVVAEDGISAANPFANLLTEWQLLNEPGYANPKNTPLAADKVTLSRGDLISFG